MKSILERGKVELEPPRMQNAVNKPLPYAAAYGNLEIVKLLVENGADLNGRVAYGDVPLIKAAEHENIDIMKYLIEQGADVNMPNAFGITPFIGFAINMDLEIVKLAHKKGGLINKSFKNTTDQNYGILNYNALQFAVAYENMEVIKYLMENGGDPELKTYDNKNCFDLAKGNKEILELLKWKKDNNKIR
ncbi:MAG: ankyrin repeat domain-containing protein [Fusobacteriota bacterium]